VTECKIQKWVGYGHFERATLDKAAFAECNAKKTLGKAGKTKPILVSFLALPSAGKVGTRQIFFLKKILCRVLCSRALVKEFFKKKSFFFAE
jgi:hypothetical protein